MNIDPTTFWTIEKDGVRIDMTLEDVAEMIHHLTLINGLILHDSVSDRSAESSDDIGVSISGTAVKLTLK